MFKPLTAGLAPLMLAACATAPVATSAPPPAAAPSGDGAMALFAVLDREAGPARNVVYSPASVEQAFGLLQLGAGGGTREQLEQMLPAPVDAASLENAGPAVRVKVANALWLSKDFQFRDSFLADTRTRYDAVAERIDVAQPDATAKRINAWADKATEHLIPSIVEPQAITPDLLAMLTNALFFEGKWQEYFRDEASRPFLYGDGHEEPFDLMQDRAARRTVDSGGWRALRLPYADTRYVMDVIMPAERKAMAQAPSLDRIAALGKALDGAHEQQVNIRLPRFEISYEAGLIPGLKAIGLTLPFCDSCADFAPMLAPGQPPVVVGDVRHMARLQVFDEGTRAAAVTAISIVVTSAPIQPPKVIDFTVDRPFIAVIRDRTLGKVLFVARVAAPQKVARPKPAEE